ncbi:hypothetical protein [Paenibacillus oleatilyticus]|uniref:hypothetical protein n=1 Tax=Paenibacillus oleatilyticus TaxID=2594886 RepID=UPI001C1F4821|nr:hypothetical protein [Paenibacillus oleatilyticus]MBU7316030.1 hypothetical protein [Paenibacillus oleatilyticus]
MEVETNKDDYVESLENLLIFMCQVYQKNHEKFFNMMFNKENDAYMKLSTVQGSHHRFAIKDLSELNFSEPVYGFRKVFEEIIAKRKESL